ncbi:hypothetical protein CBS101457_000058 [Exobasidium rhododendri]|nr:hypothetical protein CBS101457_000058 [Exobasidium rhododendri]
MSSAINDKISQAQKDRTRLACSTCRARRIKCDGQDGTCGRCLEDKRADCRYENVGTSERLAGRQRKRALRKLHDVDTTVALLDPPPVRLSEATRSDWPNGYSTSSVPSLPPPHITLQAKSVSSSSPTAISPNSFQSNSTLDDATHPTNFSSLATSMGPTEALSNGSSYPWQMQEPPLRSLQQPDGSSFEPSSMEPPLVPLAPGTGLEGEYASVDALWRVYDWQYRCNTGTGNALGLNEYQPPPPSALP